MTDYLSSMYCVSKPFIVIGKEEGKSKNYHGHVSAVTVGPDYRKIGLARKLMFLMEMISQELHNVYFVDLFVRSSNKIAIEMYKRFGYIIYRRVLGYYSGEEDAFGGFSLNLHSLSLFYCFSSLYFYSKLLYRYEKSNEKR